MIELGSGNREIVKGGQLDATYHITVSKQGAGNEKRYDILPEVQLLEGVLPLLDSEKCFALKGGTAINIIYWELQRLSVDIDLLYPLSEPRDVSLKNIREALARLSALIRKTVPNTRLQNTHQQSEALRLIPQLDQVRVKVELSPVILGTLFAAERMQVCELVDNEFGYADIHVASLPNLYAGKICAALDLQHPRDLFEVKLLLDDEGFGPDLHKTFLVFLISHQRPMPELLKPHRKNNTAFFENEFAQLADEDITFNELEATCDRLIELINTQIKTKASGSFCCLLRLKRENWSCWTDLISKKLPYCRWFIGN